MSPLLREAAKKSSTLNGRAIKRGGGVKGRAIKVQITFFVTFFFNVPTAIKLEGHLGCKGLFKQTP